MHGSCVSEDFGKTKALVRNEGEERPKISTNLGEREAGLWHETYEGTR